MNIRDEELVQRYFDHSMPVGEEQNFLIDVAARDDMRMAFRSQLELLKSIKFDKDVLGGTGLVRERTLAALGLSAMLTVTTDNAVAAPTFLQNVSGFFAKPYSMLVAGVLVGGLATYSLVPMNTNSVTTHQVPASKIVQPTQQIPDVSMPEIQNSASPAETKPTNVTKPSSITTVKQTVPEMKAVENVPIVTTNGVSPDVKSKLIIRKPSQVK